MKNFKKHGFTLVELLAVAAMIGVLAALSFGAVRNLHGSANATKCLSNLRQVGAAVQLFAGDNNASLPGTGHFRTSDGTSLSWTAVLEDYLSNDFIGKCPSARSHRANVTYGWNDMLSDPATGQGMRIVACRSPSSTIILAESSNIQTSDHFHFRGLRHGAARITAAQFRSFVNPIRHGRGSTYLFVDGHAETLAWSDVRQRISKPGNPFLIP